MQIARLPEAQAEERHSVSGVWRRLHPQAGGRRRLRCLSGNVDLCVQCFRAGEPLICTVHVGIGLAASTAAGTLQSVSLRLYEVAVACVGNHAAVAIDCVAKWPPAETTVDAGEQKISLLP